MKNPHRLPCSLSPAAAVRFDYASLNLGSLRLLGDAHLKNGTIRLSCDMPVPTSGAGRALYATAVSVRAGFTTQFAFTVATLNPSSVGGGLAFVVATDGAALGDAGAYIGVSVATDAAAVEFDTLMDVQFGDISGNHAGTGGVELTSGRTVNAWIDYRPPGAGKGGGGVLEVFVSYAAKRPAMPVLSAPLDLGERLAKDAAFIGFSASTQGSTEVHDIEGWNFSTASPALAPRSAPAAAAPPTESTPVLPPPVSNPVPPAGGTAAAPAGSIAPSGAVVGKNVGGSGTPRPPPHAAVAGAATAGAFAATSFAGVALWALARRARARKRRQTAVAVAGGKRDSSVAAAAALARSPREFSYKELSAATRGFDASRIIGNSAIGGGNASGEQQARSAAGTRAASSARRERPLTASLSRSQGSAGVCSSGDDGGDLTCEGEKGEGRREGLRAAARRR